jgi:hypothetical protein
LREDESSRLFEAGELQEKISSIFRKVICLLGNNSCKVAWNCHMQVILSYKKEKCDKLLVANILHLWMIWKLEG